MFRFSFGLLPVDDVFGFSGRIGMRKGDHGVGDLTRTGSFLNRRRIRSFQWAKPKTRCFKERLFYHQGAGAPKEAPSHHDVDCFIL
jgi:hypothetical protein